jgi:hypothetical protein
VAVGLPDRAVLDTGALIAVTDAAMGRTSSALARAFVARMRDRKQPMRVHVPAVVIAEWWRGEAGPAAKVRDAVTLLDVPKDVAVTVGLLLAELPRREQPERLFVVDAIVIVAGARVSEDIFTGDPDDLVLLRDKLVDMGKIPKGSLRIHGM